MKGKGQPTTINQHAQAIKEQAGVLDTLTLRYGVTTEATRLHDRATLRNSIQTIRARLGAIEYELDEDMRKGK